MAIELLFVALVMAPIAFGAMTLAYRMRGSTVPRRLSGGAAERVSASRSVGFWNRVAKHFGLKLSIASDRMPRLSGEVEGVKLFIHPAASAHAEREGPMHILAHVRPVDLRVGSAAEERAGRRRIGDPDFDEVCSVFGDPDVITPALDFEARRQIAALVKRGGRVVRGELTLGWRGTGRVLGDVISIVEAMVGVAHAIEHEPGERLERLLGIVADDRCPGVQARALHAAARLDATDERVRDAVARARDAADPGMRLAAMVVGEDWSAASVLVGDACTPSLATLVTDIAPDAGLEILLLAALASEDSAVLDVVAEGARRLPADARLRVLARLGEAYRSVAPANGSDAILRALIASMGPVQGDLFDVTMAALASHWIDGFAEGALDALAATGGVRAIAPLRAAEAGASDVRAAHIAATLMMIKRRAGSIDEGRLSLAADDDRGGLSLVDGTASAGSLALSAPPDDAAGTP